VKREDIKFFGALAALVELLSCVWGAMFHIAARFNTRGGDALSHKSLPAGGGPPGPPSGTQGGTQLSLGNLVAAGKLVQACTSLPRSYSLESR
jgi:hypothetical protein